MPTWVNHWRYQWDEDVRLDKTAKVAFVRYTGKPGVNVLRATVHLKPEKTPQKTVQITHAYRLGDELTEEVVEMQEPGDYTVNVNGKPENVYIRMAVESQKR